MATKCKPGCDCTGWEPIPLKPNMCSCCGHSLVFHDETDVASVSVHSARDQLGTRKTERAAELAPIKRKSVVATMIPIFSQQHAEEPLPKCEPPRRPKTVSEVAAEEDEERKKEAARRKREEEEEAERKRREEEELARKKREAEELARKKKEEEEELAARLAKQKLEADSKKPKCAHCGEVIAGGYMIFPDRDNAKVHNTCQQAFLQATCEKCAHCSDILFPVEGKFKGEFMIIGKDKVHTECYDAYKTAKSGGSSGGGAAAGGGGGGASNRDNCKQCGKAITGSAMKYSNGDKVHPECVDAYIIATSECCKHCKGPIAVIAGKFEGTYYVVGSDKVHTECWDAFSK